MSNVFEKVIADVMEANGGQEDELVSALRKTQEDLGDGASEEEMAKAIQECLTSHLMGSISDGEDVSITLEEDEANNLATSREGVREFLSEHEWHFSERDVRSDLVIFEMGANVNNVNVRVRVYVEAQPSVCRISAILPINADRTYEYLLCKAIAKENYPKRFGSFKYDESDGEVSYEYSFLTKEGFEKESFGLYLHAVIRSAADGYDEIRKNCVGKFKSKEISEILKEVNDLVTDISE